MDDPSHREGPFAKIRKIYDVNEWLRAACQRAWDPEPDAVPDESRLRLSSRYCSFTTTLLCKPIKHGLTIYCLNFCRTRYLYNFEWFCRKQEDHGRGQPTDTTGLNEDNPEEMKYMWGLMDRLIFNPMERRVLRLTRKALRLRISHAHCGLHIHRNNARDALLLHSHAD